MDGWKGRLQVEHFDTGVQQSMGVHNCLQNRTWGRITIPIDFMYAYISLFTTLITLPVIVIFTNL